MTEPTDRAEPMQGLALSIETLVADDGAKHYQLRCLIGNYSFTICDPRGDRLDAVSLRRTFEEALRGVIASEVKASRQRPAAQAAGCELGCTDVCKAREAGCASECPNPKIGRAIEAQAASAEAVAITPIDEMCAILKQRCIKAEEYTDCAIVYRVTFDQLRALYDLGRAATPTGERPAAPAQAAVTGARAIVSDEELDHLWQRFGYPNLQLPLEFVICYTAAYQVAQARAAQAAPAQAAGGDETPVAQWRCFHCEEVFTDSEAAALHFGPSIHSDPACHVDAARLRELEAELARYREEDTDLHREIHGMQARHQTELRSEEEKGYARGLADATKYPEEVTRPTPAAAAGVPTVSDGQIDRLVHAFRALHPACTMHDLARFRQTARALLSAGAPAVPPQDSGMAQDAVLKAIAALELAREFVKSRKAPGYDKPCMEAHDNINRGIAALRAVPHQPEGERNGD